MLFTDLTVLSKHTKLIFPPSQLHHPVVLVCEKISLVYSLFNLPIQQSPKKRIIKITHLVKTKLMFLAFVARVESEILFSGDVTPNIACCVKKVKNKKNI